MKSFAIKTLAVAAAAACGTTAFAGTATATKNTYATEGIASTTAVTLPTVSLAIGVDRTTAQDFTVVVKPTTATSKFNGSCPLPTFAANGTGGAATVTVKRQSASECAYEVDVTTAIGSTNVAANIAATLNFAGLVLANHGLAGGSTEQLNVGVWDLGETARIDNSADLQVTVADSRAAVSLVASADSATVINVDDARGPLFGFVASATTPADTVNVAAANFTLSINGSTAYANGALINTDYTLLLTNAVFSVAGDFDGLANFTSGSNVVSTVATSNVTVSGTGASTVASFTVAGTAFTTANTSFTVNLATLGTKSLGTARTFGVSATLDPAAANVANVSLSGNSQWWTWSANATELRSAFFNNDMSNGNFTRFFFQNTGADAAYSATCYTDDAAKTITYGTAKTGTLRQGQTTINAADICTFSAGQRGAITFVINGPSKNVKGVFQQALNGSNAGYVALERPYAGSTY